MNQLSYTDLHCYLFGKAPVRPIKIDELKQKVIEYRNSKGRKTTQKYPGLLLNLIKKNLPDGITENNTRLSRALESFPREVQLCTSSVPCVVYGVCARQHIPIGTWIGPYEGEHCQLKSTSLIAEENIYMWEIYQGGRLAYYLDGSNEETSSWMRFIACARNNSEQNLYAFQYCGNIYYRAFKEIPPGTELLVWYDDIYPQNLGVPLKISDLGYMETDEINATIPSHIAPTNLPDHSQAPNADGWLQTSRSLLSRSAIDKSALPVLPCETESREKCFHPDSLKEFPSSKQRHAKPFLDLHKDRPDDEQSKETFNICRDDESGMSLFRCGQCEKAFPQRSILQLHICSRTPNKPFECGFCGNAFANPNDLRAHSAIHCNEKPFKCGYCSRAFSGATTLNNHIRTHTGEKPFNCQKCGKTFSQGAQLSRHQRIECISKVVSTYD